MPTVKIKSRKPGDITLRKEKSRDLLKGDPGENGAPGIVRPGKAGIPGRTCHPFVR